MKKISLITLIIAIMATLSYGQTEEQTEFKKHFIGTTLFSLTNLFPDPADYYSFEYGYRFTEKDAVLVNIITWKYDESIGIPYGPSYKSPDEAYPGYVRAFGMGIGYQRYLLKGLYSNITATPFLQNFYDENNKLIQSGVQLFTQLRIGYHIDLFKNRLYIEPSVVCNYWPINTNVPVSFKVMDDRWPNYFLFEPGLNIGVKFN